MLIDIKLETIQIENRDRKMYYNELTNKALLIAVDAHANQKDKAGMPYILHPFHIAEQMNTQDETCVALLHDVIEDTPMTLEELSNVFPKEIINAIGALTRKENEKYFDYIERVKQNELAKKIKIEDLKHNLDENRFAGLDVELRDSLKKRYLKALSILCDE